MSRSLSELREYLVGEWLFQNDFRDTSGNGNHGVPTDVEWKPTSRGMKPEFNGSSSYINTGLTGKIGALEFIFKNKSNYAYVLRKGNDFTAQLSSNRLLVQSPSDGWSLTGTHDNTVPINEWNHILVILKDTDSQIYVNGIDKTNTHNAEYTFTDAELYIGYSTTGMVGNIGCVKAYSIDDFDADEVLALYNSTKHAYGVTPAERSFSHDVGSVLSAAQDENTVFATDMHTKNADGTLIDLSGNSNLHLTTGNVGRDSGYFRDTMRFVSSGSFAGNETDFDNGTNLFSITALVRANNTGSPTVFNGRNSGAGSQADGSGYSLSIKDKSNIQLYWYKDVETTHSIQNTISTNTFDFSKYTLITVIIDTDANAIKYYVNGILTDSFDIASPVIGYYCVRLGNFNGSTNPALPLDGNIAFLQLTNSLKDEALYFNKLARLPLYSLDFSKHPSNTTVYDGFLPYSSARIASGSFKVNDDKLECVTDGQIVFRNAHEFDGDEYIKLTIDDTVYAGTGTITQGTVTASISQDSTAITVNMAAGDVLDKLDIQFRRPV